MLIITSVPRLLVLTGSQQESGGEGEKGLSSLQYLELKAKQRLTTGVSEVCSDKSLGFFHAVRS